MGTRYFEVLPATGFLLVLGLTALALGGAVVRVAAALELVRSARCLCRLTGCTLGLALLALSHFFTVLYFEMIGGIHITG